MLGLSPQEDLFILATVHNNPALSWDQVSETICQQYKWFIRPADCQRRYETFLRFIDPLHEVNQVIPFKLKNMNDQGYFRTPQSFIFSYRQLKRRQEQNIQRKPTQSVSIYQKRYIYSQFFDKEDEESYQNSKLFDQNGIVNIVYNLIKQRCTEGTILNEQIVAQKIEQLFFEIIEKTNQISSQINQQIIDNPLQYIKLYGQFGIIDEKRQIFQLFYQQKQGNYTLTKILRKLRQFSLLYTYRNRNINHESEEQHEIEKTVEINYGNRHYQQSQQLQQKSQRPKQELQIAYEEQTCNQNVVINNAQKVIEKGVLIEENNGQYCQNASNLYQLTQPENQIEHFQQTYSNKNTEQVEPLPRRQLALSSHFSSSFQGIQISIHNNVATINTPQIQEQIKEQAKLQEIKQQIHQQIIPGTQQVKKVKRKRYVRRGAVPLKLPANTKTLIVIND